MNCLLLNFWILSAVLHLHLEINQWSEGTTNELSAKIIRHLMHCREGYRVFIILSPLLEVIGLPAHKVVQESLQDYKTSRISRSERLSTYNYLIRIHANSRVEEVAQKFVHIL